MNASIPPRRRARHPRAAVAALLALAVALAAGCSGVADRDLLARVGDRTVTRADFEAVAKDNASQYPGEPDSAKRQLLDDLVRRELLLIEGHRLGIDRDTALTRGHRAADDALLSRTLIDRLAPPDIAVSDSEVAALHRMRATRSHLLLIYTPVRARAEQALAELKRGQPFALVSDRYSLKDVVPAGGDVGWVVAGQLVDPLDQVAREAPVGVPQGPLAAPTDGWFVVQVAGRQPQPTGTLDAERPFLADMLRQRKARTNALKAFQSLREQYQVHVEPRGPQLLFMIGSTPGGPPPGLDQRQPLATYDGGPGASGAYTLADAMRDIADPQRDRPPFTSTAGLEAWIDSQVLQHVAVIEARRRHLDQEPGVARKLRARFENEVLQKVYERRVVQGTDVTDAEVLAHYAQRAGMFARRDSVTGAPVPPPAFASLQPTLQQNLRMEALAMKRDARLREVTEEVRKGVTPYAVHPERLATLAWPAPPPGPGFGGMPGMPAGHP